MKILRFVLIVLLVVHPAFGFTLTPILSLKKPTPGSDTYNAAVTMINTNYDILDNAALANGSGVNGKFAVFSDNHTIGPSSVAAGNLVDLSSTQTLTNKTIDTAGPNTLKINGDSITAVSGNTGTVATTSGSLPNGNIGSFDSSGNIVNSGLTASSVASAPFSDATNLIKNSSDATKLARFSVAGFATAHTNIFNLPDVNGDTVTLDAATQTLSNKTIDTAAPNTVKVNGQQISTVTGNQSKIVTANGALTGTSLLQADGSGNAQISGLTLVSKTGSSTKAMSANGSFTAGHCLDVGTGLDAEDNGAPCTGATFQANGVDLTFEPKLNFVGPITSADVAGVKTNLNINAASLAGNTFTGDQDIASSAILTEIPNDTSTGTTVKRLAKLTTSHPTTVIRATTSDTTGLFGVVVSGAGTGGNAKVAISGQAICTFDGATTAGDYVIESTGTNGECSDSGSALPPSPAQGVGIVLDNHGGAGDYAMFVLPVGTGGGGGGLTIPGSATGTIPNTAGTIGLALEVDSTSGSVNNTKGMQISFGQGGGSHNSGNRSYGLYLFNNNLNVGTTSALGSGSVPAGNIGATFQGNNFASGSTIGVEGYANGGDDINVGGLFHGDGGNEPDVGNGPAIGVLTAAYASDEAANFMNVALLATLHTSIPTGDHVNAAMVADGAGDDILRGYSTNTLKMRVLGDGSIYVGEFAVGSLPSCSSTVKGLRATVDDANATCTFNSSPTGGASTVCPVFCNGSAWKEG